MYATKPLSLFKSQPEAVSLPPPDGQNSGYLVVKSNDDGDDDETCCWGQYGGTRVHDLPFPQDRVLTLRYTEHNGRNNTTETDSVLFVSVPDQPIASNRYYAVVASGKRKGLIRTCSREEDMTPFCFSRCINDVSPQPFDPADVYQQIEIVQRRRGRFTAKAVAADGFPNYLFRKKYWRVYASMLKNHSDLGDAPGLNVALRSLQLADASLLEASPAATAMSAAVGKWYCPFYLIKEDGLSPSEQMDRATFYEVALEQRWEPVHDTHSGSKLYSRRVLMGGSLEARLEVSSGAPRHGDGYVWFRAAAGQSVGVCSSVWERMRWEEYSGGWVDEEEEAEKVAGRSVLVERFVVKRMDMTVVVAFEPVHDTHSGSKLYSRRVLMGGSLEARLEVSSGAPRHGDGYVWFRAAAGQSVGVCSSVWERMRWEEYSGGWVDEEEEAEKVAGRSVLVERFVVKRMDMTVVVAFDFVHLNKARGKQM